MKTDATYKFKCGDIVVHRTSRLERYLIVAAGTMTDYNGHSTNVYLVSLEHMGTLGRTYITEFEVELYEEKR